MFKLGLIAGGGGLPLAIADHCRRHGRPFFVIRLRGFADTRLHDYEGGEAGIGEIGRAIRLARESGCGAICFAGLVRRPDFSSVRVDARGLAELPGVIMAARKGDEGLLRHLTQVFEREGFAIEAPQQVMGGLTLGEGPLGRTVPQPKGRPDIIRAIDVARAIGALDIGQGAVVCDGLVLAVEAQEGTDAMLRRVAELPEALRGSPSRRRGVLAKAPKPIQEDRIDLPTIGLATIDGAARAGLAGIVGVAGKMLVIDQHAVAAAADAAGLFVLGWSDDLK
jgi:DUF1009 family protein